MATVEKEQNIKPAADGTVGKALELLDQVAMQKRPMRFSEIQTLSPHPKATLHRLLQTLTSQGMLSYNPDQQTYGLGLRLLRLAHAAWRQSSLAPLARPFIDALSEEVEETIHLAQLDEGQVLYVDKRNARKPIEMFSEAGKIGPGYCTGVGKAMIAFLPPAERQNAINRQAFFRHTEHTYTTPESFSAELERIRADGISFDREEHEPGIICIAAPIITASGRVLGALSVTTSTQRNTLEELGKLRKPLTKTAQKIAEAAENWQFPD
ncbi:IclR family transcriptional regulator [Pelagovum sp. HNIBRBA483]|uniref:IclR family transcriptional regulator n=1 Tax=Pelagovum sp. HNIBRBA483 TaxID=3233341 RepID=UPI0034A43207